jgi:xanthine dehydrogenase accessory factor
MKLQDIDWPAFGLDDDVRPALEALRRAGEPAVLATLFAAEGGSPRGVGAQMLFGPDRVTGYLSGGCVEADVALHAEQVMAGGEPRRLLYGPGGPADVRLPCGGRIEVLLERLAPDDAAAGRLVELWRARRPALWITDGRLRACLAEGESLPPRSPLQPGLDLALNGEVCAAAAGAGVVARRHDPTQRLVVIGADPPALAMAALGRQLGFDTAFVRPKGPASPPPVEGVDYRRAAPAEALRQVGMDAWTAVAVASHDAELDQEALVTALASPAGYVGVLGSRRRLPDRLQALRAAGVAETDLRRLNAPIGLALAGKSPWEIGLSVIAEIVQAARARERAQGWPAPAAAGAGLHAIVLAAGLGARYGGAKLLAPWGRGSVLEAALEAAFAAPAASVTVVTGAHRPQVEAAARGFAAARPDGGRLRLVHASAHAQGLSASLRRGLEGLPEDAAGAFIFLGDMPRAPHAVLQPLADALAAGAAAAAPAVRGRRGHPVLVSRELFGELRALEGDRGAAAALEALGSRLALIETDDEGALFDVDRPEDLGNAPARASA